VDQAEEKPPLQKFVFEPANHPPPPPSVRHRSFTPTSYISTQPGEMSHPSRPDHSKGMSQKEKWWKREAHPMFCPHFATKRFTVQYVFLRFGPNEQNPLPHSHRGPQACDLRPL
jgi:hypothetical protein